MIVRRGILCFRDMNWRKELTLIYSEPLEMKELKNFLILREFLVAGFLRFMNLSNITHLSSLLSCSVCFDPGKRLLSD